MALQAMEMDKDAHYTFLQACQRAAALQKEMECLSAKGKCFPTFQMKEKEKMPPDSSEIDEEEFTLVVLKAMKPSQAPELQKAFALE